MPDIPLPRLIETRPKRLGLVTLARVLAAARGDLMSAAVLCESKYPDAKVVTQILKSAITAGTLSDSDWGAPLWQYQTLAAEFIDYMRPSSILLRLPNARRVPFAMRVPRTTQSSTVGWVGDSAPKPVSELKYDEVTLGLAKVAGIIAISAELSKSNSPAAEGIIARDLAAAINAFTDGQFVDPSNAAVANVHPGSILSGVSAIASSGTTASAVAVDLAAAVSALVAGGSTMQSPLWIAHPVIACRLALLRDTSGGQAYPTIGYNGGTLAGIPCITSTAVPKTTSGGSIIALIDQAEIMLADDGQIRIDVSGEAAIQMDSEPSSSAAAQVSLWQSNLVGIRVERVVNWAPRRAAAATASFIDAVSY